MWQWLEGHARALGLIVAVLPVAWSIWTYFRLKRKEQRSERFQTYHSLIKQLVQPDEGDDSMKLDRQLAVVFELRRFPEYYEPSLRILKGLRKSWGEKGSFGRLFDEIDATILLIEKRSKRFWKP